MTVKVPQSAQGAFTGTMNTGNKIELPFPAPAFYILNGDQKFEELKNIIYFGGWGASAQNVKAAAEQWENCPFPIPGFLEKELTQKGKKVPSLLSRILVVAPIRMSQFSKITDKNTGQTKRFAPFTKGASPALQVIAYLGFRDPAREDKRITPWAPVMLTVHGWQVNHVTKAFGDWKKAITPFMSEIAPGMPADVTNLFWMHIGTFGNEAHFEQHGESAITPMTAYIPDDLTAQQVENMYVGDDLAEFMASLVVQSEEWGNAYKNAASSTAGANEPEYVDEPPPPDDGDIPF